MIKNKNNIRYDQRNESWCAGFLPSQGYKAGDSWSKELVAFGMSSFDSNAMKSSNPYSGCYLAVTSRTLDINGANPACHQGGVLVVEIIRKE